MLGAPGVQIPENNVDNLQESRREALETVGSPELMGSNGLAFTDFAFLDFLLGRAFKGSFGFLVKILVATYVTSCGLGFLRVTALVVVILVKGH